jgi:hypothetical protein
MLTGYAFITERQQTMQGIDGERFFDMHRLVHIVSNAWLHKYEEWTSWTNIVMNRLEELVPWDGHKGKEVWAPYLSHAVHTAGHEGTVKDIAMASLLDRVGRFQTSLGQYAVAETSHRQASSLRKEVLGFKHPDTLTSMNNLALVLDRQGKYGEAVHRQTLARREKVLRYEHSSTLTSIYCLAHLLAHQHRYYEALTLYDRASAGF